MRLLTLRLLLIPLALTFYTLGSKASSLTENLLRLQKAYPGWIQSASTKEIVWYDGTHMALDEDPHKTAQDKLETPSLLDQINQNRYQPGMPLTDPTTDAGRIRYSPFFQKMYGETEAVVESKLVTIYWMPAIFLNQYPLHVTTVNGVHQKLMQISHHLESLVEHHPEYLPYLENPGGTFIWRMIANTNRLSLHSFGMTIDINATLSDYWQKPLPDTEKPSHEATPTTYQNQIPWDIVKIFERQGFIWGGKWQHFDTMHFEYRPELMPAAKHTTPLSS